MKITKITYGLDTTINMGDYENYKPQIMAEAKIEEGDCVLEAMAELKKFVQTQLMEDVKKILGAFSKKKNLNKNAEEIEEAKTEE